MANATTIEQHDTYVIPAYFISAVEYGDYNGMGEDEIQQLEKFIGSLPDGYHTWQWADESYFSYRNDVTCVGGDVIEATLFVTPF